MNKPRVINKITQISSWSIRAWPVIIIVLIIAAHWALVWTLPGNATFIDKWTSAMAQGIGGSVVIHSINKNSGSFGRGNLWAIFIAWLCDFPWPTKRNAVASGALASILCAVKIVRFSNV